MKKHWCPCTGTSGCFSVTTLGAPARQGNVAQGQTSFVSLHKCPRLLLGHHQTHGPCKTTQYISRSKSIGVLARVLLDASRSRHSGLLQDKAMLRVNQVSCPCTSAPGCFSVTTKLTGPVSNTIWLKVKKQCCPCTGTSGCFSVTTLGAPARQGNGAQKFRVLAQVPPVASRSPPNSRALQNNTIWLKVKKHWCPCTGTSGCFSVTTLGAPARQGNVAQGQTSFVSLHKCPVASRSPPNSRALQNNTIWLKVKKHRPCTGTSGCFSVTTLGAPARQGNGAQKFRVLAQVPPVASRSPLNSRALQNNTIWLKVKKHWCPCTGTSGCFSVTTLGAPARQGNVAQGQTSFVSLRKCPRLLLGRSPPNSRAL